jgi:two-component system response regulator ChvI
MIAQPSIVDSAQKRVVIVDDDDLFRESLGLNLSEEGYQVVDFDNGEDALTFLLGGQQTDVVLLDWRMPVMDGLGVLRRLREARCDAPVIFLTVLSDQIYEEAALKFGAVDFIEKSRRLSIILQRLKLIIEGPKAVSGPGGQTEQPSTVHYGQLELRVDIKRAFWAGEQVDLTLTEFSIVQYMAARAGHDVTYRQIYDLVRGKDFIAGYGTEGYRANVRAFIKRIRKKFRDVDDNFSEIENYPGFGYRWRPRPEEGQT